MQISTLLSKDELECAKLDALFDLVLCGSVKLWDIPIEHRLIHRHVYIAAFRHARSSWPRREFLETDKVLAILETDMQIMVEGQYRRWLESTYTSYKTAYRRFKQYGVYDFLV